MKEKRVNAWHSVYGVTYEELNEAEELVRSKYGDILDCKRPEDPSRRKASRNSRAAQFSPFAALAGFDEKIEEEQRLTDMRIELSEEQKEQMDRVIQSAEHRISEMPELTAAVFREDPVKPGGAYVTVNGRLKKIDRVQGILVLADGIRISIGDLAELHLLEDTEDLYE